MVGLAWSALKQLTCIFVLVQMICDQTNLGGRTVGPKTLAFRDKAELKNPTMSSRLLHFVPKISQVVPRCTGAKISRVSMVVVLVFKALGFRALGSGCDEFRV